MRNKKIYGGILFVTLVIALFWESALIRTLFAYEVLMLPLLFLQAEYFARNLEFRSGMYRKDRNLRWKLNWKIILSCRWNQFL